MADEQRVVRGVSWNEVFSFSHIFKSFKMAIHPSKIFLALLAIILTCALGLVMDKMWSGVSDSSVVMPDETWGYWRTPSRGAFGEAKKKWLEEDRVGTMTGMLTSVADMKGEAAASLAKDDFDEAVDRIEKGLEQRYDKALTVADDDWKKEHDKAEGKSAKKDQEKGIEDAEKARLNAKHRALRAYINSSNNLKKLEGSGIFAGFMDWQGQCVSNAIGSVRRGNFATGISGLLGLRGSMASDTVVTNRTPFAFDAPNNDAEGYGVLAWIGLMLWGLWWMISTYPIYSLIYITIALAIWSVLGGAICRIAALHATREEKTSIKAAISFSVSKFIGFFTAPLLPIAVIVFCGLLLAAGGLAGAIPVFGEWIVAISFFLALMLGMVIAFLTIGLIGGAPLMWPTIAVEGSDSFDAISRSISYTFNRPFRYALYWVIAAVYGTICYLFVRLFAFIMLLAVHFWAGWSMGWAGRPEYEVGAGKLDVMWAKPTFESFHAPFQFEAMSGSEAGAAVVMSMWVYIVIGVVAAFGICFFFSAATNIYCLLRRKIDATDLDDVYIEEAEEAQMLPDDDKPAEEAPATEEPAAEESAEESGEEKSE